MALYDEAAEWYDRLWGVRRDYQADADTITRLIEERNPDARSLLDVGCATGEHLRLMRERYACAGVDASPSLLEIARTKLGIDVPLHEANMSELELAERFDVIICLWGTIAYARDHERLAQAAERMAAHLRVPGVVIVEPWLTLRTFDDPGTVTVTVDDEVEPVLTVVAATSRSGSRAQLRRTYVVAKPDAIRTVDESHELGVFTESEYRDAFEEAGFQVQWHPHGLAGRGLLTGTL